jgi:trimeric autotransporter adhesin
LNTTGYDNTAIGYGALYQNTTGFLNTASGFRALYFNTIGKRNTANGLNALYANTTGSNNTAEGYLALASNTTGINNIGLGLSADGAISTGSNNIDIGNVGVEGDSKTIRLGDSHQTATFIAGVSEATVAGGVGVIIDTNGHLGTISSSARVKEAIQPMDKASEAILALQPVTFRYKHELDPQGIRSLASWRSKSRR